MHINNFDHTSHVAVSVIIMQVSCTKQLLVSHVKELWLVSSFELLILPQGLIFVVDSNDRERINEAKEELQKMVSTPCLSVCTQVKIHVLTHLPSASFHIFPFLLPNLLFYSLSPASSFPAGGR